MSMTEAAKLHLASLAERGVGAEKKANENLRKEKTTTKRTPKPKKLAAKKDK